MQHIFFYRTIIGHIGIMANESAITRLYFDGEIIKNNAAIVETPLLKEAGCQLHAYLDGRTHSFSLPLAPAGTLFMKLVWESLRAIPYGKTRSYKEIANDLGNVKAARAVGSANNKNPIPIFIPCHRVIGSNGKLIGFRGGLSLKERLLFLERQHAIL